MAVWTYYILREFKPEALENLPEASDRRVASTEPAEAESGPANGNGVNGEVSNGDAEAAEVTPEAEASPAPPTDQAPEVPEASEANTNGTNGSEAPAETAEASDKVPCSESEVGFLKDKILPFLTFFFLSNWVRLNPHNRALPLSKEALLNWKDDMQRAFVKQVLCWKFLGEKCVDIVLVCRWCTAHCSAAAINFALMRPWGLLCSPARGHGQSRRERRGSEKWQLPASPAIALRCYFCDAICRKYFYRKQDFSARSFSTKLMISGYLAMTLFISTIFPTLTKTLLGPSSKYFSHYSRISDSSWERKRAGSGTFWKIWGGRRSFRKCSQEASHGDGAWGGRLRGQEDLLQHQRGRGDPGRDRSGGPQRCEQHPAPHHLRRGLNTGLWLVRILNTGLSLVERRSRTCDQWSR